MLYDRSYMRNNFIGKPKLFSELFILGLIITFFVQVLLRLFSESIESHFLQFFSFSFDNLANLFIWVPLSYTFLHDGIFHLLMNLLGLFFIGRVVEMEIGKINFCWLCILSSLFGSFIWLVFNINSIGLVGASAVVMGTLSFYCFKNPEREITLLLFFILPCKLKPKWLLVAILCIELYGFVFSELPGVSGIAHSSHLGGVLSGFFVYLYLKKYYHFPSFVFKYSSFSDSFSSFNRNNNSKNPTECKTKFTSTGDLQKEVDRILDKINDLGFGSLNSDEKKTLEKAKELLRN
jgi:membrane associated rhomboid family serine protease